MPVGGFFWALYPRWEVRQIAVAGYNREPKGCRLLPVREVDEFSTDGKTLYLL
jgi:hypothetical protein